MNQTTIPKVLKDLEALSFNMKEKDFLLTWELSKENLLAILKAGLLLKELHRTGRSLRVFDTGLAVSIFRDNSTRTRFSFASAVNALGLTLQELDERTSQIAHGETERETAVMISFLTQVVGIRDDIFLGEGDRYQRNFIQAMKEAYQEGILHQRPVLVNLQSDIDHPTQSMSDLAKLIDYFGGVENLKGKKIAVTWAYSPSYGKPLSVPQGVIGLVTRFGMEVTLAYPKGYELLPDVVALANKQAKESGGSFTITDKMEDAFKNADAVYPKSWAPYQVMVRRTELLKSGNTASLKDLEKECLATNAKYKNWECTEEMMKLTRSGKGLYMHCLPADISGVSCKEGEVAASVFDAYRKDLYHQASFKPFLIAAIILLSRMDDPLSTLKKLSKGEKSLIL
ncbi:MAG: knotted carbamoyltransferase YgeW [Spirochaetes bacterium]|nr:knotted carbamoyltransferase YgeW [Spirochaetota bacterium]